MSNVVPRRYRGVAVTDVDVPLRFDDLRDHFLGREAYRRTEFIVVRNGDAVAVLRVRKASDEPLFSPITEVEVLAGADETVEVHAPDVDTGVPTQLARVARGSAADARCVVVRGRYEHEVVEILRSGAASGAFAPMDAQVTARGIIALLNGLAAWYRPDGPIGRTEIEEIYWGMVARLAGIGATEPAARLQPA